MTNILYCIKLTAMRIYMWIAFCMAANYCYAQEKIWYIDPDQAIGIKASNLFSAIRLIPLQTTKESNFTNMADFVVTPDRLIFTDNESNAILIFDKAGKFLYKYKKRQYTLGGLQYIQSKNALFFTSRNKNYTIPKKKMQQMLAYPGSRDFAKYINIELMQLDSSQHYKTDKLPVPKYALQGIYYLDGTYIAEQNSYNKYAKDTVLYHANLFKDDQLTASYFPFLNAPKLPIDYDEISYTISRTLADSVIYIQRDYDHTIYRLSNNDIQPAYRFVFPATHTMPASFQTTAFKNNIDFTNFKNNHKKAIRKFFNIVDLNDYLFIGMNDNDWSQNKYVLNKNNAVLYNLNKITSDSSVYYLPQKIFSRLNNYDKDYIYTFISSDDLLKEKQNLLNKYKDGLPPELAGIFEKLTKFNNPVIVQLKVKPNTAAN